MFLCSEFKLGVNDDFTFNTCITILVTISLPYVYDAFRHETANQCLRILGLYISFLGENV